jgi:Cytochrome b5-like Heme/Steroid binding domain
MNGGSDATEEFNAIHSLKAHKMLNKYYIGTVDLTSKKVIDVIPDLATEDGTQLALHPKKKLHLHYKKKLFYHVIRTC